MLRHQLVCGVNHVGIQKCLLAEKDLTLEVALSNWKQQKEKLSIYELVHSVQFSSKQSGSFGFA